MHMNLNTRTMDIVAQNIIKEHDSTLINGEPCAIPIEEIIELHYGIRIEYRYLTKDMTIHGMTIFEDSVIPIYNIKNKSFDLCEIPANTILIDSRLNAKNRQRRKRFTLAHELAHYIMHAEHFLYIEEIASKSVAEDKSEKELEADELASSFLMPSGRIRVALKRLSNIEDKIKRNSIMSDIFEVSPKILEMRLKQLALN